MSCPHSLSLKARMSTASGYFDCQPDSATEPGVCLVLICMATYHSISAQLWIGRRNERSQIQATNQFHVSVKSVSHHSCMFYAAWWEVLTVCLWFRRAWETVWCEQCGSCQAIALMSWSWNVSELDQHSISSLQYMVYPTAPWAYFTQKYYVQSY